ncbi:MAG: AMP-binding protein [Armatimonadetes bacterium]|nr:AMP-binding protein [Akkermansiaceae bacterium]
MPVSCPVGSIGFRTSGSTGRQKWVILEKRALLLSAKSVNDLLEVGTESKWGLALPLNHVGGFVVAARAYLAGCGVAKFEGKWDADRFADWAFAERITHVSMVPTQVHDLVKQGLQGPADLKAVVVGGGRLSDELGRKARDAGWPVLASYGMTEACSQVATQEIGQVDRCYAECPLKILPIWETEITDEGRLKLKGPALFSGTLEERDGVWVFVNREGEWFETRDRVELVGDVLKPIGRADSLVKIMGELVDLEAVEKRFLAISAGRIPESGFAVFPSENSRREHVLVAVFEEGLERESVEDCFDRYQKLTGGLERFKKFLRVDRLPRSELGKLRRGELGKLVETILREEQ